MIKWNRKKTTNGTIEVPYFVYSKKGVCLHLDPCNPDIEVPKGAFETWQLKFSCYTGGQEGTIATKILRVKNIGDSKKYVENLKSRAGKVAHKMVNQYAIRLANFKDVVEE